MRYYPQYSWLVSVPMLVVPPTLYVWATVQASRAFPKGLAFDVKNLMRVYNVAQILLCTYMTIGLWPVLGFPNVFGVNSVFTPRGEWFVFVHYLSKYMDWLDTFFIISKGNARKQLSFLHVYHHATIGICWGIVSHLGQGNGTIRYGALINSVTHVLMYSHYLWTSFGFSNPFKKLLTTWQIFQFYTCFFHSTVVITNMFVVERQIDRRLAWVQLCYHTTMIYLFTWKLYWVPELYIKHSSATKEAASKPKKTN
ncbi:hypothetical protein CTAYLR_004812 [Chrysophaeum taylorii]|uniref:Elongation of fatty acids protein n=1 Tax=Chrysophaeum taylorii TaxID=2483200 RepID=A0AAD7UMU8_9STRA|nr:hypothetical protein CTAYLR_004812 [Chrysophaeum taylorii]